MIILDTNIVSEFMTSQPNKRVLAWLNDQPINTLYLTSITLAEINYGLSVMPVGKRRQQLSACFDEFVNSGFAQRVLSFDRLAAQAYGDIMSHSKHIGRPMSNFDGQIAAIARINGFNIATRNIKDFEQCQLVLVNPFIGNR